MNARAALFAFRRVASPATLALIALLAFAAAATERSTPPALAREGLWNLVLVCAVPLLVARAAAHGARLNTRERNFVAASPHSPAAWFRSSVLGLAVATLVTLALAASSAEFSATNEPARLALRGVEPAPQSAVLDGRAPVRWSASAGHGETLRVELVFVPVGTNATVELRARRESKLQSARALFNRSGSIEVSAPEGDGELSLELERVEGDALLLLVGGNVQRFVPAATPRLASVVLALHAGLALWSLLALAFALATWMAAGYAASLAGALALGPWLAGDEFASTWSPWGQLFDALALAGKGYVPAEPSLVALGVAVAQLALAGALFAAGIRRGGRGA
ncbi:MAG: hypothetical protein NTV21_07875 [Planctomycetota bacterium]|nr:hypothetical protein [Planctomycetota bacterium]